MKKIIDIIVEGEDSVNNNRIKNGALIGSVVGMSLGMVVATKMNNVPKKKIMKTAKKAKSTILNGMQSLWG